MVSPLKYYRRDPMNKGRGAGYYYKRSHNGNTNWKSKFEATRDAVRKAHTKISVKSLRYQHTGDMKVGQKSHLNVKFNPRAKGKKLFGWL